MKRGIVVMYKRETKKQFEKRMVKELSGKRLTKNQALWELEAHKLRNRLAQAEKHGFVFHEDIVGTRPEKVFIRDIERLRSIKGNKGFLKAGGDVSLDRVTSGAVSIRSSKRNPMVAFIVERDGQFVVTTNWTTGMKQGAVQISTKDLREIGPDMETMTKLLAPSQPVPVTITPDAVDTKIDVEIPEPISPVGEISEEDSTELNAGEEENDYSSHEDFDYDDSVYYDPQVDYYSRTDERDYDNALNVQEGEAVLDSVLSELAWWEDKSYAQDWTDFQYNFKSESTHALWKMIQGAIEEFGKDRVAYLVQEYGADEFNKLAESVMFYVGKYTDSRTVDATNTAMGRLKEILFQDNPILAAEYDFEDYENV